MITGHCSGSNFIIVSCEYCFWSFEVSGYFKKEKKKRKKKKRKQKVGPELLPTGPGMKEE